MFTRKTKKESPKEELSGAYLKAVDYLNDETKIARGMLTKIKELSGKSLLSGSANIQYNINDCANVKTRKQYIKYGLEAQNILLTREAERLAEAKKNIESEYMKVSLLLANTHLLIKDIEDQEAREDSESNQTHKEIA